MTHNTQIMDMADVISINKINGMVPDAGVSTTPASAESAAPPPMVKADPRPDADPAKAGRTDKSPALDRKSVV